MAGTRVLMADGTHKAIEDIRIGDQVWAADPETGEEGPRTVLATIVGEGVKTLVEITVDTTTQIDADTLGAADLPQEPSRPGPTVLGEKIVATDGHPFWVPLLGEWVDAVDLVPGMWFLSSEGTLVQATGTRVWAEPEWVYNLTVHDLHTYYVLADETSILVHNCNADPQSAPGGQNGAAVSIKQGKMALGRAGMSVSQYDIVHVPEIRTAGDGLPAYGNSPHDGSGKPNLGPRGRPVIQISDMGLADMDTAVATIFHEVYHHRMYANWPGSMGGTESAAEAYGQAMLGIFRRRTGS
ncbi:polymorphic toxin-type HINT domain-containing protein [Nocardiopsis sp. LDBS0036]|uniref:polymorphic toxin-type HINT domain-containing protein n=1 Tax=Nocardiopsis sp. LDBS0036 TaxID=3104276 RepID=UPI0035118E46